MYRSENAQIYGLEFEGVGGILTGVLGSERVCRAAISQLRV